MGLRTHFYLKPFSYTYSEVAGSEWKVLSCILDDTILLF